MRKHIALGTLLAMTAAAPALASGNLSYNLIEAGYVSNEIDGFGLDGSGFALGGSFEFYDGVFGFVNLVDADYDQDSGVSTRMVSVGLGFAWPLGADVDLVSSLSYEHLRLHIDGAGGVSDSAVGLGVGVRGRLGESFELTAGVKYIDAGHDVNDFTLGVGGRYYFTPAFAAGVDVADNDDGMAWTVMLRYDFGGR